MFGRRDQRVRVLQALEGIVKQFRTREELWPLRVPAEPLLLDEIVARTLGDQSRGFNPLSLRSRSLLRLTWDDSSTWELWVMSLASGIKLYCDSGPDESRILASGRRDSEIDTDRLFLELLAESGGETFGIGVEGGPPSRVQSSVDPDRLVEFFVHLFEVAGMEEDVRAAVGVDPEALPRRSAEGAKSGDFRADVERWLNQTKR
jgi:hypothetical protein